MQTMPKSNTPIQGGGGGGRNGKHRPHSNNQRNRSGSNGSGSNNDNPLAKRRTSQESSTRQQNNRSRREESNNDTKSLKRSFTKGDKLTKLMSSKLPPTLFSVASGKTSDNAANGVNRGKDTYRDTSDRSKQQSPPPKHWKEASRSTSNSAGTSVTSASVASTASASESHMSSKLGAALLSINKRKPNNSNSNSNKNNTSRSSDNDTFDTYSTGNDSGTYDSRTYDSGMSTLSVGSESYTSYASGSYVSRASKGYTRWKSKRGARTSDGRSSGDGRDKLYVRRYAKIVLGVVGLAAMRLIGERNGNDGRMSWEEWDPKWGTRMIQEEEQVAQVNKLRARRLPQVQGDIAPAAPDIVSNPPIQEVGNQIIESDWEVRLRSWKSPEDEEDDDDEGEDEWDPKWDPKPVSSTNIYPFNPQDTTKVEAAATPNNNPTTTSQQVKPKGKNDALFALREKNRLEHLENWKD